MSKKDIHKLADEKKKKLSKEDQKESESSSSSQSSSINNDANKTPTKNLSVNILTEKDQTIVDSILQSGN